MVYATCSLWPEENEKQIENFLAQQGDQWELQKEINIWPNQKPFDGFYAASLHKKK